MLETLAALFAVIGGIYAAWLKFLKPRTVRARLLRAYRLIEEWYNSIDCSLEQGYNAANVSNLEGKVSDYIRDSGLKNYQIRITPSLRRNFLKMCGIRADLRDNQELFAKYSRCTVDEIYLDLWWVGLLGSFYRFESLYRNGKPGTNWADVEMQVKFLKMYVRAKTE